MNILILGGTVFLGHHLVEEAVRRGHRVTMFTRGLTNSDAHPGVERLVGDRDGNLSALQGRRWDAVIDTSGYVPRLVGDAAELLKTSTGLYAFISSISVYRDLSRAGVDETADVLPLPHDHGEDVRAHYGALKAESEAAVRRLLPGRALVIRPGLIVGPNDPTDRFTYWPVRIARGGEVLAPGPREAQVQFIDVRDLAAWTLSMVEAGRTGVYNATGPAGRTSLQALLETCCCALGSDARLTWVDEAFLVSKGVGGWIEMPLWIPDSGEYKPFVGMMRVNIDRALDAGLTFRPLAQTVRDTLAWHTGRTEPVQLKAGLAPQREAELLAAWHAGNGV
ncbi:epimerase [Gordoniibacillus kamchatkensis]|uniref:Epimerase n=1 Tax=Gordoniibacillus kamchatkensis TaxID=1590651 RepID=A0ABR5ACI5_9BACL|nr:NAD-dependent epimerase/dehydratase family protein [Paenibacillus sp. VKM B-2647]KIL38771.1 epimerase [Paenibacillus sp. VKM B-2647]